MEGSAPTAGIPPQERAFKYYPTERRDISWFGRQDYKEAMVADCEQGKGYFVVCSTYGTGWFVRWRQFPHTVLIPDSAERLATQDEDDVIRRAVAIVNRVLPADKRLSMGYADSETTGLARDIIDLVGRGLWVSNAVDSAVIYAEIVDLGDDAPLGLGWTDGGFGTAQVQESLMGDRNKQEYAVQTMVHEILHAMGLMGHPHHTHTSVLSYQHESSRVFDNVPLIDVAVLYDMYGWGNWTGRIQTVFDKVDGVQFGVHRVWHTLGYRATYIPWVEGGFMPVPPDSTLSGTASWSGALVGVADGTTAVTGVADLAFEFDDSSGSAEFHSIYDWNGNRWNQTVPDYDLYVNGTYFDSDDEDGIPDVVGAFYGVDAEVAAGTLQRPEITAAFGATRDD